MGRIFGVLMEWLNEAAYRAAIEGLSPRPRERILEIGYGTGRLLELLLKRQPHCRIAGIDPSATMQQVTHSRLGRLSSVDLSEIRLGMDHPLPWPSGTFDAALAVHSFQFWPDPEASLDELRRVLIPSGRLLFVLRAHRPGVDWLPNPMSKVRSEAAALTAALAARGFEVTELRASGSSRLLLAMSDI